MHEIEGANGEGQTSLPKDSFRNISTSGWSMLDSNVPKLGVSHEMEIRNGSNEIFGVGGFGDLTLLDRLTNS